MTGPLRRGIMKLAPLVLAAGCQLLPQAGAWANDSTRTPNIVWIMADDND